MSSHSQKKYDDYCSDNVPDSDVRKFYHILMVIMNVSITLPMFVFATHLGNILSLRGLITAVPVGCGLLMVLAFFTGSAGSKSRLTTYQIIKFSFGTLGSYAINLILALSLFGWYAFTSRLLGLSFANLFHSSRNSIWVMGFIVVGGFVVMCTALVGIKAIDKISRWLVPIMVVFFSVIILHAVFVHHHDLALAWNKRNHDVGFGKVVSLVVGSFIGMVVTIPDLTRYLCSSKDVCKTSFWGFGVYYSLLLIMVALPGMALQQSNFLIILSLLGIGVIPSMLVIIIDSWTTNAMNLYSSSLVFSAFFEKLGRFWITVIVGILGTVCAVLFDLSYFLPFLMVLSIVISPIATVYALDCCYLKKHIYHVNNISKLPKIDFIGLFSWAGGVVVGFLCQYGHFYIIKVPIIDSVIAASLLLVAFRLISSHVFHKYGRDDSQIVHTQ